MRTTSLALATATITLLALPARAELSQAHLKRLLRNKIEAAEDLADSEKVLQAVREQNKRDLSLDEIKRRDREWIATSELTPLKNAVLTNDVANYFRSLVTFENSIYSEIFLTGRHGETIAAYPLTTDYWQGDEEKWTKAYAGGNGEVYVGPVAYDESSKSDSVQISVPVLDKGKAIGVIVVGVKLSYIQARYLKERR